MKQSIGPKTIVYPTPVFVVATYDAAGRANAMTVAWGGLCCSDPPSIAIAVRKNRYTYENIVARQAFTVNIPSVAYAAEADYFGIVSGRKEDKFAATGLTAVRAEFVDAPYIAEFPLVLECALRHEVPIGAHVQIIGEILDVKVDSAALGANGAPDIERVLPLLYAPGNESYYGVGSAVARAFSAGKKFKGLGG